MKFKCGLLNPEIASYKYFEASIKEIKGHWGKMLRDFTGRIPAMIVAPTPSGIYTLERIK